MHVLDGEGAGCGYVQVNAYLEILNCSAADRYSSSQCIDLHPGPAVMSDDAVAGKIDGHKVDIDGEAVPARPGIRFNVLGEDIRSRYVDGLALIDFVIRGVNRYRRRGEKKDDEGDTNSRAQFHGFLLLRVSDDLTSIPASGTIPLPRCRSSTSPPPSITSTTTRTSATCTRTSLPTRSPVTAAEWTTTSGSSPVRTNTARRSNGPRRRKASCRSSSPTVW